MAGVRRGAFTCVGWQVTLCDPTWKVTSEMGSYEELYRPLPLSAFLLYFQVRNQARMAVMLLQLGLYVVIIVQLTLSQPTCDFTDIGDQLSPCEDSDRVLSQLAKVNSRLVTAVSQLQAENAQLIQANAQLQTSVSQLLKNVTQLDRDITDLNHQQNSKG